MRRVESSEAKARLAKLLDDVEGGETVVITRHGREIARIVPIQEEQRSAVARAKARIEAFRKRMPRMTIEEILSARHEGHEY
jgi:prevent-host-death family protein